jgi:predicted amidohydrolase YtcJ
VTAPDKVLLNGAVVTRGREGEVAEAVAIHEGKITAVGSTKDIRALAGAATSIVDLGGKTLLPGFYAAHDHFPSAGRVALYELDLNSPPMGTMRSVDDIVAALREKAARTPPGKWVVGRGYDDTLIRERRHPTRHDLDRASSDHRIMKDGKTLGPEERISTFAALRAVTLDAAWQNFEEKTKGSIEVGKLADLVILAENPLTADPARLKDIEILETIVGGNTCFTK